MAAYALRFAHLRTHFLALLLTWFALALLRFLHACFFPLFLHGFWWHLGWRGMKTLETYLPLHGVRHAIRAHCRQKLGKKKAWAGMVGFGNFSKHFKMKNF